MQSCLFAAAVGAGTTSKKLRLVKKASVVSRTNQIYLEAKRLAEAVEKQKAEAYQKLEQQLRKMSPSQVADIIVRNPEKLEKMLAAVSPIKADPILTPHPAGGYGIFLNPSEEQFNKFEADLNEIKKKHANLFQGVAVGNRAMNMGLRSASHIAENAHLKLLQYIGEALERSGNKDLARYYKSPATVKHTLGKDGFYVPQERKEIAKNLRENRADARSTVEVFKARARIGLSALAGAAGMTLTVITGAKAMSNCAGEFGLTSNETTGLLPFLETVAVEKINSCDSLKISAQKLEQQIESDEPPPQGLCKLLRNRNKKYESQDSELPILKGDCSASELTVAEKSIGKVTKSSDGFDVTLPRSGGGEIKFPYAKVGDFDFDMSSSHCTKSGSKLDPDCVTYIRNLYKSAYGPSGNTNGKIQLEDSSVPCKGDGGYMDSVGKDLCPFVKSANLMRSVMAIHYASCFDVGNEATVDSDAGIYR